MCFDRIPITYLFSYKIDIYLKTLMFWRVNGFFVICSSLNPSDLSYNRI